MVLIFYCSKGNSERIIIIIQKSVCGKWILLDKNKGELYRVVEVFMRERERE